MKTKLLFLCVLWPLFLGNSHPMYISICEIDYNAEAHSLEIALRVFIDDLEAALEAQGTGRLFLGTASESENTDRYIGRYLGQTLKLTVNGKTVSGQFLGKEIEQDVVWCYVEILNVEKPASIGILNQILTELHETQQNIVHIRVGKQVKSFRLSKGNKNGTAEFD